MGLLAAAVALSACLHVGLDAPAIAIIVDDLGNRPREDYAALETPGPLTYAILPFSPLSRELAAAAHRAGKDVLLHLPMEADDHNHLLGPGAVTMAMPQQEFSAAVRRAVDDVPHAIGVNNHMGSRLTRDAERMDWLMTTLSAGKLLFLDSRTTSRTVARRAAAARQVPFAARDVFLDNRREPRYIHARFDDLVEHAVRRGEAVGIAHPHAETLVVLRRRLADLEQVRLVSLSDLVERRACRAARAALRETAALR